MALANLNINVNANTQTSITNMLDFKGVAIDSMGKSGNAVKKFQNDLDSSAKIVNQQSSKMSSDMKTASESIAKTSNSMGSSIDGISSSATDTSSSIKEMSKSIDSTASSLSQKLGPEASKTKQKIEELGRETKDYVKHKLEILAVAAALGVTAATIGILYSAYKSLGFVAGLFTGESYKSKNIDFLIAETKAVEDLRERLQLAIPDVAALRDALGRTGTNKSDYVSVYEKSEEAIRSNGDELDRLGVKYKSVNGSFLENRTIVENAKKVLDRYTEGWDRNKAAPAIAMGSYAQISEYLKVTQEEFLKSRESIDIYNLGVGPETQAAVDKYQAAVREFNNDNELMAASIKRTIADATMPALTGLAESLKGGFPIAVNSFRYSVATIVTLGYGLKEVFNVLYVGIGANIKSFAATLGVIGDVARDVLRGDFAAAKNDLIKGWDEAERRTNETQKRMAADAKRNTDAMRMVWGFDGRDNEGNGGAPGSGKKRGKIWAAAPAASIGYGDHDEKQSSVDAAYYAYEKSLIESIAQLKKDANNAEEQANQIAYDWGLTSLQDYLNKKHTLIQSSLQGELDAKKEELEKAKEAEKKTLAAYADPNDRTGSADVSKAYKTTQDAQKAVNDLLAKQKALTVSNAEESKKGIYEQEKGLNNLAVQIYELTEQYEKAAKVRIEFYRSSPEYLKLSPAEKAEKDKLDNYSISQARQSEKQTNTTYAQSRMSAIGGSGYVSNAFGAINQHADTVAMLVAQKEEELITVEKYNAEMLKADQLYNDQKTSMALSAASEIVGIISSMGNASKEAQIAALVVQKGIAIAQIVMQAEVAKIGALAAYSNLPGGVALAASYQALISAQEAVAIGLVVASGAVQAANIAGKAEGGDVQAGQTYWVGEKGPELFTPGASGMITANNKIGGTVSIVNNIDARNSSPESEQRIRVEIKKSEERTKAAILSSMNRGGPFAKASGRAR